MSIVLDTPSHTLLILRCGSTIMHAVTVPSRHNTLVDNRQFYTQQRKHQVFQQGTPLPKFIRS